MTEVPELTTPAWVADLTLQEGLLTTTYDFIDVEGFVATDIAYNADSYYAVSGDNGILAQINKTTHEVEVTIDLEDLRAVGTTGTKVVALSGTEGIKVYSEDLSPDNTISTTEDAPFSKRTIDFYNDYVLVSEGANGLGIYDLNTGDLFQQVSIPPYEGSDIDPADVVTNAVSSNQNKVFVANGGAGVAVYNFDSPTDLSYWGSTHFPAIEQSSSNFVVSRDNYVFVASGKGGLKILKMIELTPPQQSVQCGGPYEEYSGQTNWPNFSSGEHHYADEVEFAGGVNLNTGTILNWCGGMKVNGDITINSDSEFNLYGTLAVTNNLNVNSTMNLDGATTIGGNLIINGGANLYIKGTLSQGSSGGDSDGNRNNAQIFVNGKITIEGEVAFYGNLTINGGGEIEFVGEDSKLIVYGNVTNNGNVVNGSITNI